MTAQEKVEFIQKELPDYQRTLEAAADARAKATAAKEQQDATWEEGERKLDDVATEIDDKNAAAAKEATEAETKAQLAEQKAKLEIEYLVSIISDKPGDDPTPSDPTPTPSPVPDTFPDVVPTPPTESETLPVANLPPAARLNPFRPKEV